MGPQPLFPSESAVPAYSIAYNAGWQGWDGSGPHSPGVRLPLADANSNHQFLSLSYQGKGPSPKFNGYQVLHESGWCRL